MKKTTILTTLALSALVLAGLAPTTHAADPAQPFPSTSTEGIINFKTVDDTDEGEVTKPDTEEEIIVPDEGGSTTGPLRMTHVPNFDFGTVTLETKNITANAKFETFKETQAGAVTGDSLEIAHFAQVEDIRGLKDGWSLSLSASKFIPSDLTKNIALENSHIILAESQLFNTTKNADISTRVTKLAANSKLENDGTSLLLMKVNKDQHTDSSKTSLVFNDAYTYDELVGGVPAPGAGEDRLNPGVQIKAYGTDEKAVAETYTATLTWTLAQGY